MFVQETKIKVRYYETDQMGIVHHSNYIRYFEIGRTESIRQLGISYRDLEASGVAMPITEVTVRHLKPAYYDDELTIRTIVKEMPTARIHFLYEIYNGSDTLICDGTTTLAFMDIKTGRPQRPPIMLTESMEKMLFPSI